MRTRSCSRPAPPRRANLAIFGTARARPLPAHVVTSAIEHAATEEPCALAERTGDRVTRVGVDRSGVIDLDALAFALGIPTRFVRNVARGILVRFGYRVIEANNGQAALVAAAGAGRIDLLLTDVVMPQMSGPALAKRLLETSPELKVLFVSGYTDDSVVRHGVLSSEVAYLQNDCQHSLRAAQPHAS